LVRRHREQPQRHNLVFTQAPPGVCGCLVSATLMAELAQRNRLSTIGGLLTYQPHAPQVDPVGRDACVQVEHGVRRSLSRATCDTPRWREAISATQGDLAACGFAHARTPQHIALELTTQRASHGAFAQSLNPRSATREPLPLDLTERLFSQLAEAPTHDLVLTLHGAGDPLLHPHFEQIIHSAKQFGIRAVHLRTELLCDRAIIDRLLASGVDVVSVDLNADRAATHQAMMGVDRFRDVLMNMEYLIERRRRLTPQKGTSAMALPWVVPHLQRRAETYEDIDTFFDRWQHMLGTAVIDDPPADDPHPSGLTPATSPPRVAQREAMRRMTILCDGRVPLRDLDFTGESCAGDLNDTLALDIWRSLYERRMAILKEPMP
jgi:hypothetical protein